MCRGGVHGATTGVTTSLPDLRWGGGSFRNEGRWSEQPGHGQAPGRVGSGGWSRSSSGPSSCRTAWRSVTVSANPPRPAGRPDCAGSGSGKTGGGRSTARSRWRAASPRCLSLTMARIDQGRSRKRLQEALKRRLILAAQPATAQDHAGEQFSDAPQLGFAAFRGEAVEGDPQPAMLVDRLRQAFPVLPFVTGQQREVHMLIEVAYLQLARSGSVGSGRHGSRRRWHSASDGASQSARPHHSHRWYTARPPVARRATAAAWWCSAHCGSAPARRDGWQPPEPPSASAPFYPKAMC